jgi:hypothetical protein
MAVVVAVAVFGCIISVPEWIGIDFRGQGALSVFSGLFSIMALVAAWYGARWIYRRAHAFLLRYVPHESHECPTLNGVLLRSEAEPATTPMVEQAR